MTENRAVTIYTEERSSALLIPSAPQTARGYSIDAVIDGWLDEKFNRSKAIKTYRDYKATITDFRSLLRIAGYDLIFESDEEDGIDFVGIIGDAAQLFQSWRSPNSRHKGAIAESTQARRMYILSSFYSYAIRRRHLKEMNPIETVGKPQVEQYSNSEPIPQTEVMKRLRSINAKTEEGAQSLALLSVLLFTGRRVSEVQRLTRKDVQIVGKSIKLDFPKTKRGKHLRNILSPEISLVLAQWLNKFYLGDFWNLPDNTPLWVQIYHDSARGEALGYHGIAGIVERYLGTTKVHRLRHTFALLMVLAGATEKEIQEMLGHSNLAITSRYLEHIKIDENKHNDKLTELLGFKVGGKGLTRL